ncbi:SPOR domain-containing protein [Aliikangiella maris]|uniref:SPOR domain-containing protein n=2 Tax=Aliikangiella maris TaxID=3162458 RepID=A0ABV2BTL2_9GAMM
MPRDYAKKKPARTKKQGASRSQAKASVSPIRWLLTIGLTLTLAGGLIYLKWFYPKTSPPPNTSSKPVSAPQSSSAATKTNTTTNKKSDEQVPFYDVHRDLTTKQVKIPKEDLKLPEIYKKYFYTMPCGSFREIERAEELKAQIAMTGNKSELMPVKSKGETWYRVQLGPFSSKRTAEKIRHRLEDNNIQDCMIRAHLKAE